MPAKPRASSPRLEGRNKSYSRAVSSLSKVPWCHPANCGVDALHFFEFLNFQDGFFKHVYLHLYILLTSRYFIEGF